MQWTSESIVIKQQPFNDEKSLCWVFSAVNGLHKGLLSINKKSRIQIQVGSIITATWKARLPEHLGNYYCELLRPLSMSIINDKLKLSSVISICDILCLCLPEKTPEEKLYDSLIGYLLSLKENKDWVIDYLKLELLILQEIGYGLSLDRCVVTGSKEDLHYVSPKTGMAASKQAGEAYHDKLLLLPQFLINDQSVKEGDLKAGFELIEHFIYQRICKPQSVKFPLSRKRFFDLISSNS